MDFDPSSFIKSWDSKLGAVFASSVSAGTYPFAAHITRLQ